MDSSNTLTCRVIMLPTPKPQMGGLVRLSRDLTSTIKAGAIGIYNDDRIDVGLWNPQHLYFVSGREIKHGEAFYENTDILGVGFWNDQRADRLNCFKIEASTDSSLRVPLISKDFINEFMQSRGSIKSVLVDLRLVYHGLDKNQESDWSEFEEDLSLVISTDLLLKESKDGICISKPWPCGEDYLKGADEKRIQ